MRVPVPGSGPDALSSRWHAHAVRLRHRRAPEDAIEQLGRLVTSLPLAGQTVLITANRDSAAYCTLTGPGDEDKDAAVVGQLPRLIPALAEIERHEPSITALVDRVGADIYETSIEGIHLLETVTGTSEFIHRSARGGWSQRRFQTRAEQVWESNARLVSQRVTTLCAALGAERVLLSGDTRACLFVLAGLPEGLRWSASRTEAGGRHEAASIERIRAAALAETESAILRRTESSLQQLSSELKVGLRAVRGLAVAIDDIVAGMVRTLFVTDRISDHDWFDFAAQRALETGAGIVICESGDDRLGPSGLAAILRHRLTRAS